MAGSILVKGTAQVAKRLSPSTWSKLSGWKSNLLSGSVMKWGGRALTTLSLYELIAADNEVDASQLNNTALMSSSKLVNMIRIIRVPGKNQGVIIDSTFTNRLLERVHDIIMNASDEAVFKSAVKEFLNSDNTPTISEMTSLISAYPLTVFHQLLNTSIPVGDVFQEIIGEDKAGQGKQPLTMIELPTETSGFALRFGTLKFKSEGSKVDELEVLLSEDPTFTNSVESLDVQEGRELTQQARTIERELGCTLETLTTAIDFITDERYLAFATARERGLLD